MKKEYIILIFVSLLSLVLKLFYTYYGDYHTDLVTFQEWSLNLIRHGFGNFYNIQDSIYPPGYLYVLWFVGKVYYFLNAHNFLIPMEVIYKIPAIISDNINAILIFYLVKKYFPIKSALISAVLFLFNPAVFINSTYWGQIDSFVSIFILGGLLCLLNNKFYWCFILLALGQATKPIVILTLPIIFIYMFSKNVEALNILKFFWGFLITYILIFIPFNNDSNLINFLISRNSTTISEWQSATSSAFNFWAVISIINFNDIVDTRDNNLILGLTYWAWGMIIYSIFYSYILLLTLKNKKLILSKTYYLFYTFCLIYFAMFLFLTRMHERHLFYAVVFMHLILPFFRYKLLFIVIIFAVYTFNLIYAFSFSTDYIFNLENKYILVLSIVNIAIYMLLFRNIIKIKEIEN